MSTAAQVLGPDAVAALVDAATETTRPGDARAPQRPRRLRSVDFTRPTKFTTDQERRLKRGLEAFCRTASTRLSAELRVPLELEVLHATQLTWGNAHAQLPSDSITALVAAQPIGTRMMLTAEPGLLLGAIELLLGGARAGDVRARRLTDIDWALARHFFDRLLAQLSLIFADLAGLDLSLGSLESHMEAAHMVSVSEPTLTLTMEARLDGSASTLALILPWTAIAPVADRFAARDDGGGERGPDEADSVRRAVGRVDMTLRAEVAAVELPIEQVLALRPGDVLRLDAPADGGVMLYADKVPVHRTRPGRSGVRRAVQVVERAGEPG